jgi:ABC-type sugar transport system substrate-binding protein
MTMRRLPKIIIVIAALILVAANFGSASAQATPPADGTWGENYKADPQLLIKAVGSAEGMPDIGLAAVYRAGLPVTDDILKKAIECFKTSPCDTGTGGKISVAMADGYGLIPWREISRMEFILQALTYKDIGKIAYTDAKGDLNQALADIRSDITLGYNIIVGYPDAGDAVLPAVKDATKAGVIYIPYSYGTIGTPGTDYPTTVAEDVCVLGKNFAEIMNKEVGKGKIVLLGGTPGNPLSAAWQDCEVKALSPDIKVIGKADTNWTQDGTLAAMSGFLSTDPDLAGVSYEYAGGFEGGVRAYQAAKIPLNLVLTLRTDEDGLFCQLNAIKDAKVKIYYSAGGNFQARVALTAGMMKLAGATLPTSIIVPGHMRQADASTCNPNINPETPLSTLIPLNVIQAMYPASAPAAPTAAK